MGYKPTVIGILDIGMGNLRSVANAVYEVGFDYQFVADADSLSAITHLIIPGVGHFGYAMGKLNERHLREAIDRFIQVEKRPVLGICLGCQVLTEYGEEGQSDGLGYVPGRVTKLDRATLPVPHTGWNSVDQQHQHPIFKGIKNHRDFYFVHSFEIRVDNPDNRLATTDYGGQVTCAVSSENVVGVQFHPEKSQKNGLQLLENFCRWDGVYQVD